MATAPSAIPHCPPPPSGPHATPLDEVIRHRALRTPHRAPRDPSHPPPVVPFTCAAASAAYHLLLTALARFLPCSPTFRRQRSDGCAGRSSHVCLHRPRARWLGPGG